jgi:hypothetical protein
MQVTLGEEGSRVSIVVVFFLRSTNIGLDLDLLLLLLAALVLKNLISGGGNLSVRAGLEMVFDVSFMFLFVNHFLSQNDEVCFSVYICVRDFWFGFGLRDVLERYGGCGWFRELAWFLFCKMLFPIFVFLL